jgi:hypothetical protein
VGTLSVTKAFTTYAKAGRVGVHRRRVDEDTFPMHTEATVRIGISGRGE